jgi:hypothetical protein
MSESADGLIIPATRQKPGRLEIDEPPGGVNDPYGTASAVLNGDGLKSKPGKPFATCGRGLCRGTSEEYNEGDNSGVTNHNGHCITMSALPDRW